jgi:nucleoside-diphosphate-sugar epimerase
VSAARDPVLAAARAILGPMAKRTCVTGASGRAGRVTVAELLAHGYDVVATDRAREALGFVPRHSWRDHLEPKAA